jgi:hypothetical protein
VEWSFCNHRTFRSKDELVLYLVKHCATIKFGGSGDIALPLLITVLGGGEWSASRPGIFTPGEKAPCTHWIGGWIDPRIGLNNVIKRKNLALPGIEPESSGPIAIMTELSRLQSLNYLQRR